MPRPLESTINEKHAEKSAISSEIASAEAAAAAFMAEMERHPAEAESTLMALADVFYKDWADPSANQTSTSDPLSDEARYRALVEQISAVVFMASLDKGIGDA